LRPPAPYVRGPRRLPWLVVDLGRSLRSTLLTRGSSGSRAGGPGRRRPVPGSRAGRALAAGGTARAGYGPFGGLIAGVAVAGRWVFCAFSVPVGGLRGAGRLEDVLKVLTDPGGRTCPGPLDALQRGFS
jgi:hypothetical protein